MRKNLLTLMLIVMMALSLSGCTSKKTTVKILIKDYTNFESLSFPKGIIGKIEDDYLFVELSKNGEYDVVIKTDDGRICDLHITYENGNGGVTSENVKDLVVEWQ